ncbi:uncharacterized protein [Battus philenor]|uniref:uncharacterized protein n=1 Tax=Battus philenor TaxID=42288 RepID=UPI0035CF4CB7
MSWTRPANIPTGRVWSRFRGRERSGQPAKMYQIRDMEETDRKRCLDMMEKVFLRDEPLCQILDINADIESLATIRSNWERFADQGICVACYTEEDGSPKDLVGFNVLIVKSIEDEEEDLEKVSGENWKKLLTTLVTAENQVNLFEYYGVDRYMTSSGLTVVPEHRGQNIGARIIEVREAICKACGIEAVATVFTAKSSQVLAAKCGYEKLAVLPYEAMLEQEIDLTKCDCPNAILMGKRIEANNMNSSFLNATSISFNLIDKSK